MEIDYDDEFDILRIVSDDSEYVYSIEMGNVLVDINTDGKIKGLEVIEAKGWLGSKKELKAVIKQFKELQK